MIERIREARKNESGFTLIELLIVIVILGVLAGIVVFAVGAITDRGHASACKSDLKNVQVAAEAYFAKNATYPTAANVQTVLVPGYLHNWPADTAVTYTIPGAGGAAFDLSGTNGTTSCTL